MPAPVAGVFPIGAALEDERAKGVWDAELHSYAVDVDLAVDGLAERGGPGREREHCPPVNRWPVRGGEVVSDHHDRRARTIALDSNFTYRTVDRMIRCRDASAQSHGGSTLSTFLGLVALIGLVIGVIALIRGHLQWARISSRKTAGIVTAGALGLALVSGAIAPDKDAPVSDTSSPTTSVTATTTARPTTTTTTPSPTTTLPPTTTTLTPTTTVAPPPPAPVVDPSTEVAVAPLIAPPPAPEPAPAPAPAPAPEPAPYVPSPKSAPSAPSEAIAQCKDGTYSYGTNHRGACSKHGGVAVWLD